MNIWDKLAQNPPFFVLAPMDDVTDTAFRRVVAEVAAPDLFFTEFASVDGLQSPGRSNVMQKFKFTENEQPLIAQIWGLKPDNFYTSAQEIAEMGFDGIDLNMGCPTPVVTKKGACSALINNPPLAAEIIDATKKGAGNLPVSVKTRIGFKQKTTEDWCGFLLEQNITTLTVHGRTAKELSKVPNHWDEIGKVVELRNSMGINTYIVGNGDVASREDGLAKASQYKLDGIMIGRGIFKDPWIFDSSAQQHQKQDFIQLFNRHIELFEKSWGADKNPATLKKFAKMYINGFEGASDLRAQAMMCTDLTSLKALVKESII